jgi:hypothetical protein
MLLAMVDVLRLSARKLAADDFCHGVKERLDENKRKILGLDQMDSASTDPLEVTLRSLFHLQVPSSH